MRQPDHPAPLDERRMKLIALSGQIRATLRDGRPAVTSAKVPSDASLDQTSPNAEVPLLEVSPSATPAD